MSFADDEGIVPTEAEVSTPKDDTNPEENKKDQTV